MNKVEQVLGQEVKAQEKLKQWRQRMKLTQETAADKLGSSVRAYRGWEKGDNMSKRVLMAASFLENKSNAGKGFKHLVDLTRRIKVKR